LVSQDGFIEASRVGTFFSKRLSITSFDSWRMIGKVASLLARSMCLFAPTAVQVASADVEAFFNGSGHVATRHDSPNSVVQGVQDIAATYAKLPTNHSLDCM